MKRGESMRSCGYTLIEIAGVMAVLGILLGASLLPLNRQLRESEYRQERANMERLSDAVLGYALRHRTPGVEIVMFNDDETRQTELYAKGRPYLPCPDSDGDGIENRTDLINPVMQTLSRSFGRDTPRYPAGGFIRVVLQEPTTPILFSGACHADKGQLPWRSLGSIPADYWGNRYTYFADSVFTQEATGFDEKTVADSGERRLPRVLTTLGVHIPQKRVRFDIVGTYYPDGRPSVICPAAVVDDDVRIADKERFMCGLDGAPDAPANIVAGEPAPTTVAAGIGSQFLRRGDIADGLPFVIVSHGHNGFGAVNHLLSRQKDKLICRLFADEHAHAHERANAHIYWIDSLFNPGPCDAFSIPDPSDPDRRMFIHREHFNFSLDRRGYFFARRSDVSAARAASSLSDQIGLDDLLVWMTRGDLARRMREADVFPLIMNDSDRPPIFYEPL